MSEVERVTDSGNNLIMDIDVKGALNVKKLYGDKAIAIFIMPPSLRELENRLRARQTENEDSIRKRLDKAEFEISLSDKFDKKVVNDQLEKAVSDVERELRDFIET